MGGPVTKAPGATGPHNKFKLKRPVIAGCWVIGPEVPDPKDNFLAWPVTKSYMDEDVQIRLKIDHLALTSSAEIVIEVKDMDKTIDDDIALITNVKSIHDSKKSDLISYHRQIKQMTGVATASWKDTNDNILLEIENDAKSGDVTSYLLTAINLPEDPSGVETDDLEYYFHVTIKENNPPHVRSLEFTSSVLIAHRWWAKPSENLYLNKTHATSIKPLVDGEAYFAEIVKAIDGATKYVYVASWTMWPFMFMTKEPGGGGKSFADVVKAAAGRNVDVYILMDYFNGSWVVPLLKAHVKHAKIHVKTSSHPDKILGHQHGSYHEKYVCVDGKTAFVGGIDVQPDRYQVQKHNWKSNHSKFETQAAGYGMTMFDQEFLLWHDAGVKIAGYPVEQVEGNFRNRWNAAPPQNERIKPTASSPAPKTNHDLQIVKTDLIETWIRQRHTHSYKGTLDAYRQAIIGARHFIYIENQYFSYPGLCDLLYKALTENTSLQLIAVIPFATEEAIALGGRIFDSAYWIQGGWSEHDLQERMWAHGTYLQAQMIKKLRKVTDARNRVGIYGLAGCVASATNAEMIYPHSKTMIVDDTWAYIGSANTNGRGFVTDGEMGAIIHNRNTVTAYRRSLWKEHLGIDLETKKIRDFFKKWKTKALRGKKQASDCSCSEVSSVHAVQIEHPPKGQEYNGHFSSVLNVDDYC